MKSRFGALVQAVTVSIAVAVYLCFAFGVSSASAEEPAKVVKSSKKATAKPTAKSTAIKSVDPVHLRTLPSFEPTPAFDGITVTTVSIAGNNRIEKDAIAEKMSIKAGAKISRESVRKDILAIFDLGFFEDVRMELNGQALTLRVKERPVLSEIVYEGSEEFEKKDLDEVVGIKPFTVLNLAKIRQSQLAISKKYEEKGYYLARAEYKLVPVPERPTEVKLVFNISENEKVRVRKIYFSGNDNFTSGDLKQVLMTSEGHFFSWATGGGTYREEAFERDLSILAFYYGNEGYIDAKFTKPRVSLSQDRRYIDIFIDVEEGQRYNLGEVKFSGQELMFSEEELRKSFEMKKNEVFSAGKLQEQILKLTDKYGDEGYAFANVIPKPEIHKTERTVDLTIDIERGEKVYWGKIAITGNTKTHDKVIRRELQFSEGELYNATKRKKGLERIRRLGFFGQDVNFVTSTPKGTTNILDLEIRVQEKPTGSLNVSAGFGTSTKFTLQGQVAQNNLFGLGQQLSFDLHYDATSTSFSLGWTNPKVFDSEWLLGFDLYYQADSGGSETGDAFRTYDQRRLGTSVRTGREISEDLGLYGTYKLAHNRLINPISEEIFLDKNKDPDSIISSITATLAYDTRNNRIDPSGGNYLSASSEFAGLGGRVFQKYLLSARVYRRLFWKVVFRSNVEYGLIANSFNDETVPVYELFSMGGIGTLRGYPYFGIGPAREVNNPTRADAINAIAASPDKTPRRYVLGGRNKILINEELEFPLIPEADIRAVLFYDAGNAWGGIPQDGVPTLYTNYGWGIRWYSPLGPLRFEWGYPLQTLNAHPHNTSLNNRGSQFWFIIAPTF